MKYTEVRVRPGPVLPRSFDGEIKFFSFLKNCLAAFFFFFSLSFLEIHPSAMADMDVARKQFDAFVAEKESNESSKRSADRSARISRAKDVVESWMHTREHIYGFEGVDDNHICTVRGCIETKSIEMVHRSLMLYGCVVSGVYHMCAGTTDSCRNVTLGGDGMYTCTFSGVSLGPKIERRIYGKPKTNMAHFSEEAEPTQDELDIQESIERSLRSVGGTEIVESGSDKGATAAAGGGRRTARIASLGPVPDTQSVHEPEEFVLVDTSSHSSGAARRANKRRRCFSAASMAASQSDITAVVYDLLYNASERRRIDSKRVSEMKVSSANAIRKFYKRKKRAGTRPMRHEVERIRRTQQNKKMRLRPVEHDSARTAIYVRIIYDLWKLIIETPYCTNNWSKFHIKQHAIGMLYMLQMDFATTESGVSDVLLNADGFLYEHLPHQSDLREWRSCHKKNWTYSKQDVTVGRNNFKKSLSSIQNQETKQRAFDELRRIARIY